MGADRAILVESGAVLQPLGVAKLLKAVIEREQPDLVILGKQAIDDDAGQTGQMLAALLGWGQGTFISELAIKDNEATVTREVDGGTEKLALSLPAILTADLRLNEPRFVKLPNLMLARKKPIETIASAALGVNAEARLRLLQVAEPPPRKAGIKVGSVQELLQKLREQGGVPL
jgi:electron transfer flavoprotein beta subunit